MSLGENGRMNESVTSGRNLDPVVARACPILRGPYLIEFVL
jgi:hypothetical protein